MKFTDFIKRLIRDYFIIFAVLVISITLLRQLFSPDKYITTNDIFIYMICSLASDLTGVILYSPEEIPEKEMRIRIIIHFIVLEAVVLTLASFTGWVTGVERTGFLALQVAVIYTIVRLLLWLDVKRSADSINEKLKLIKNEQQDNLE